VARGGVEPSLEAKGAREPDVAPAQRDELALAQTRKRGREEDRRVELALGVTYERVDLPGAADIDRRPGRWSQKWATRSPMG